MTNIIHEVGLALLKQRILTDSLRIFESPLYKVIPSFDTRNLLMHWVLYLHHSMDSLIRVINEEAIDEIIELTKLNSACDLPVSKNKIVQLYDKALWIAPSINEEIFQEILIRTDHSYNDAFHAFFYAKLSQESKRHLMERLRQIKGKTATLNQIQLLFSLSNWKDWKKLRNELIKVTSQRIQTKRVMIGRDDVDHEIMAAFFDKYQNEVKELAHFPDEEGWKRLDKPCPLSRKLPAPEGWDNYSLWEKRTHISYVLEKFPPFFADIKEESMATFPAYAEKRLESIEAAENEDGDFQIGLVLEAPSNIAWSTEPPEITILKSRKNEPHAEVELVQVISGGDCPITASEIRETLNELPAKMQERFEKRLTISSYINDEFIKLTYKEQAKRLGYSERTLRGDDAEFKRIYNEKLNDMPKPNPAGRGIKTQLTIAKTDRSLICPKCGTIFAAGSIRTEICPICPGVKKLKRKPSVKNQQRSPNQELE